MVEGPGQLQEIEGIPAALVVDERRLRVAHDGAQELSRLGLRERTEFEACQRRPAMRPLERGRETVRRLAGTKGQRDENGCHWRPAKQRAEQLDRSRIGPVEVVEDEDEGLRPRKVFEERTDRSMDAITLVLERRLMVFRQRR